MGDVVIKVENLSKQYRLGEIGTGSIAHDLNRWWHLVRGKEDPYLKVGETNDRTTKGGSDYVWALKEIEFEVKHGEVLGIIGRNGAGKSTLLKILSKTTTPTVGSVKLKGRIASLLEVGTGFHPELSGRDNIFLNGAILGMSRREIKTKFDEIVDFAGVERYIDTPVKRYSSGMYVRLAFAVAAHLEPEILIVDEVLAVGDAEFQKKCLGKMKDVSVNNGRTVLFVSHNMAAVQQLCTRGLLIENGRLTFSGSAEKAIGLYLSNGIQHYYNRKWDSESAPQDDFLRLKEVSVFNSLDSNIVYREKDTYVEIVFEVLKEHKLISTSIGVKSKETIVFVAGTKAFTLETGVYKMHFIIPKGLLNDTDYILSVVLVTNYNNWNVEATDILQFSVHEYENRDGYIGQIIGLVRPEIGWSEPVKLKS